MAYERKVRWSLGAGLLLLYVGVAAQPFSVEKIVVGAIFDQNTEEIQNVFKYAMNTHNQNISSRRLELQAYVDVINTADAFKLSRLRDRLVLSMKDPNLIVTDRQKLKSYFTSRKMRTMDKKVTRKLKGKTKANRP